jgi:hypothetical protein
MTAVAIKSFLRRSGSGASNESWPSVFLMRLAFATSVPSRKKGEPLCSL